MSARFTHTSLADFKSLLVEKSGIPMDSYIIDDEWNSYINEALLTYGAIANAWKSTIQIKTVVNKSFYDITTDLFTNQPLLAPSITIQDLLNLINYHLVEEISEASPTSEITSLDEILKFARDRISLFQYLTSHFISKKIFEFSSAGINQLVLDDEVIDILRVAYLIDSKSYMLHKEDEQDIAYYQEKVFNTPKNAPDYYTTLLGDLNQIFIYPPPANLGTLEVISINGISTSLTLTSTIPLANNLTPYIKYGILADIFSKEGIGQDLARASYCEERWREGIQIGLNYSSILFSKLNGVPIQIDSVEALDNQQFNWQNESGKPNLLGSIGYNLLATNRVPDAIYSIDIDSVTNAYLPKVDLDIDYIDIKKEYIGPFADYVLHLASIKSGFAAIKKTDNFRQSFVQGSLQHNLRLMERGLTYESLLKKTKLQIQEEPLKPEVTQTQAQT